MRNRLQHVAKDADGALYDVNDSTRTVRGMLHSEVISFFFNLCNFVIICRLSGMQELVAFKNTKDSIARSIALVESMMKKKRPLTVPAPQSPPPAAEIKEETKSTEISFKSF